MDSAIENAWDVRTVEAVLPINTMIRRLSGYHKSGRYDSNRRVYWVKEHGEGRVGSYIKGYPDHRCPDHATSVDCVCGGDDGIIEESEACAVVAWEAVYEDGTSAEAIELCVFLSDQDDTWEIVPS